LLFVFFLYKTLSNSKAVNGSTRRRQMTLLESQVCIECYFKPVQNLWI